MIFAKIISMTEGRKLEHVVEVAVWIVLILVLFGVQFFPRAIIDRPTAAVLAAGITAFALFYYYIAWKFFAPEQRRFFKDLIDIVFIGLIIFVAKDYGAYFFALLFLPIAAAAFTLELVHSLVIASGAAVIIASEILLSGEGLLDQTNLFLSGGQLLIFLMVTLFARFLALQIRHERDEKELARARAAQLAHDLEESRKLEAMERQFVDLASHQLFTPISIIRGFASMLRDRPRQLTKVQLDQVNEIYENSRRMVRLIDGLRLEARIAQGRLAVKPQSESLSALVRDLTREFTPQVRNKHLRLTLRLPKTTLRARFDNDATRQILWNLLDNAIHYTPAGGRITTIGQHRAGHITLTISDTGIGIPHDEQPKMFQRFFRASNAIDAYRDGTGLGLVIAKELADRQHGTLTFTSEVGKGSTFTLTLPGA